MNFIWTLTIGLFALSIVGPSASSAGTLPDDKRPLAIRTAECKHLLLVKRIKGVRPTPGNAVSTTYRIVDVGKSVGNRFKAGDDVTLNEFFLDTVNGIKYPLWCIMSPNPDRGWYAPGDMDERFWKYIKGVPPPTKDLAKAVTRAAWFIPWLEHEEHAIAVDA